MTTSQQLMKDAAFKVAQTLLKANNTVTTLEVKVELRKTDPDFFWTQPVVSRIMDEFAQEGKLVYTDNGVYRIYSDPATTNPAVLTAVPASNNSNYNPNPAPNAINLSSPASQTAVGLSGISGVGDGGANGPGISGTSAPAGKTKKISKKKAIKLIKDTKGHFFKAVFTKGDGSERLINCQYLKDQPDSPLGLIMVKEASLMKQLKREGTLANIPSKSVIRSFNINSLKLLGIGGQTYKVKN